MNTVITANVLWRIVLLGSSRLNLSINLYIMELSPKLNTLGRWKGKHSQGGHTGETDTPWHTQDGGHLAMNLERGTWGQGASLPMVLVTITPLLSLPPLRLSHSEHLRRFWLHFLMDLNHCVKTTTRRQQTAIVGLILTLDHRDSEDGFVPRDGSREVLRAPEGWRRVL